MSPRRAGFCPKALRPPSAMARPTRRCWRRHRCAGTSSGPQQVADMPDGTQLVSSL